LAIFDIVAMAGGLAANLATTEPRHRGRPG
jgi:hypothetical protein